MSYIVVKKSERDKNGKINFLFPSRFHNKFLDIYGTWPRVIEPIIDRKHHQHVRLCCPNGEYVNVPVSKNKHGVYEIIFRKLSILLFFISVDFIVYHIMQNLVIYFR